MVEFLYVSDVSTTVERPRKPSEIDSDSRSWGDSPRIAIAIRAVVFLLPILLAFLVTLAVAKIWSAPSTVPGALARFVVLGIIAIVVASLADRGARRFLPLAALYRLSLVFPDRAPSRFAIALRSGNTKLIEQRLADLDSGGFVGSEADAAMLIVEFAGALSEHDRLTRGHSERVRAFTALIAEEMGLSEEDSNRLQWAGLIHDVGKLRIPQEILTKPGRLTDEEFDIIKTHPAEGMTLAEPLAEYLGDWIGAIGEHHERFDGNGYPQGLAGNDISLGGRIVAVADAYDVITAARSYKKPLPPAYARQELADNAGTQFDPAVVRAFLGISIGRLRRAMWPLSWAVQVPFIGTAITTPLAQTVAATVVTLAAATGATAATGGFEPLESPDAIAFVEQEEVAAPVEESPVEQGEVVVAQDADTSQGEVTVTSLPNPTGQEVAPAPTTVAPIDERELDSTPTTTTQAPTDGTTTTTSVVSSPPERAPITTTPTTVVAAPQPNVTTTTTRPRVTTTTTRPRVTTTTTRPRATTTTTTTTTTTPPTTTTTGPGRDCSDALSGNGQLQNADLRNCDLTNTSFYNADFRGADLTGAMFQDVTFNRGLYEGAIFDNTTMERVNFIELDLNNASFVGADIETTGFLNVNLTNARFNRATITDVAMNATLVDANFSDARLTLVGFDGSDMTNANLTDTVVEAIFNHANVTGARFTNAQFTNSQFYGATGTPSGAATASYDNVLCTTGIWASANCW